MKIAYCFRLFVKFSWLMAFSLLHVKGQIYLSVSGKNLTLNGEKVFLSGMNQAWYYYSRDFGHKFYERSRPHLLKTLDEIKKSGGNSVRIWLHTTGAHTPRFNKRGRVTGLDRNFIPCLVDFVKQAQQRNILVIFTLWNCAGNTETDFPVFGLLRDEDKLQSFIKKVLPRMVRALRSYQSVAMWEVINEPEGCVIPGIRDIVEPCYDTTTIPEAGWTKRKISLYRILRFTGLHAHVIHREDPKALVTVGSWNYKSVTNQLGRRDFFTVECLQKASGGLEGATIDLYQIHTYDNWVEYEPHDPFKVDAALYAVRKPIIIGEFSQQRGGRMTSEEQFLWAYRHGYSGAWSWCARQNAGSSADDVETQMRGMMALKGRNNQEKGGRVNITLREINVFIKNFTRNMSKFYKDFKEKIMLT